MNTKSQSESGVMPGSVGRLEAELMALRAVRGYRPAEAGFITSYELDVARAALDVQLRVLWHFSRSVEFEAIVDAAVEIMDAHEEGARMDEGFDAGEFSGPAHAQMEEKDITDLAEAHGFTYDEVMDELCACVNRLSYGN